MSNNGVNPFADDDNGPPTEEIPIREMLGDAAPAAQTVPAPPATETGAEPLSAETEESPPAP